MKGLGKSQLLGMYEKMLKIRRFEEKMDELSAKGRLPGGAILSPYTGEEAIAVGVMASLKHDDFVASSHRGIGHVVARGVDPKRIMAEIYGKRTGTSHGKGGRMGIADRDLRIITNGIVAWGIPIATGCALTSKIRKSGQVAVSFFGDGACNTGVFHESLNMASLWKLPVIYVLENNHQALTVSTKESTSVERFAERAKVFGVAGVTVDGTDVFEVYEKAKYAIEEARRGSVPSLLECITPPLHGSYEGGNMPKLSIPAGSDPIEKMSAMLEKSGIMDRTDSEEIEKNIRNEIDEATKFAEESPYPPVEEALAGLFADEVTSI